MNPGEGVYVFIILFLSCSCNLKILKQKIGGFWALECGLSSCVTWVYLLHSMWDLPEPGIEPMFPALAGRFLSTVPPEKSLAMF